MADTAKGVVKSGFRKAVSAFFEYDTPKIVHIKSKKVGVINRIIQLCILGYIIGYAIVYEKGYQDIDAVESVALTKLKGVTYTLMKDHFPDISNRTWDVADVVVPPEESDAMFLTTNLIITANQTQGTCDEDPGMLDVICTSDDNCTAFEPVVNGNGVRTGKCIESSRNSSIKVCEIYAWCPVEVDQLPEEGKAILDESKKFTVLIKNWIEFPKFNVKRRNIIDDINNKSYLQGCRYNQSHPIDQFCPIFEMDTIVNLAGETYENIAVDGGVIAVNINWDCNLDFDISKCKPTYGFKRLDEKNAKLAKGWNFRYAHYYREQGVLYRDLIKAYGIRLQIKVTGQAGKFSVVPLLLNLGSGIGLLAIATVLCDIIVMYVLKNGDYYQEKKYFVVSGKDAFQGDFLDSNSIETSNDGGIQDQNDAAASASNVEEGTTTKRRNKEQKPGAYSRLED